MQRAVFLDRDGVLVDDKGWVTRAEQFTICAGVPAALNRLKQAGYLLVMVTNQAVVARGLLTWAALASLHAELQALLIAQGAPAFDSIQACPHHPNADVPEYREACECRKPQPGMLLSAARTHCIDLQRSFMVGDRLSDVAAGRAAGCQTVWVHSGAQHAPPIESALPMDSALQAEYVCPDLSAATVWILSQS